MRDNHHQLLLNNNRGILKISMEIADLCDFVRLSIYLLEMKMSMEIIVVTDLLYCHLSWPYTDIHHFLLPWSCRGGRGGNWRKVESGWLSEKWKVKGWGNGNICEFFNKMKKKWSVMVGMRDHYFNFSLPFIVTCQYWEVKGIFFVELLLSINRCI